MCGGVGVEEMQEVGKEGLQHLLEQLIVPNPAHVIHARFLLVTGGSMYRTFVSK